MKRPKEKPVACARCGVKPTVGKTQFRGSVWTGKTGWRVFCGQGAHNAVVAYRAHKADAIADWNKLQSFAQETGRDPAKFDTRAALSSLLRAEA